MAKDSGLFDAIADRQGKTCQNHDALVEILKGFDKRLRRIEFGGIIVLVGTISSVFKESLVALLLKIAGG
jgi:hypothetical protein